MKILKMMIQISNLKMLKKVIGHHNKIENIIGFYNFIISILFLNI